MTDLELTIKYFEEGNIPLYQISKRKKLSGMGAYSFLVKNLLQAVQNGEVGITKIKRGK